MRPPYWQAAMIWLARSDRAREVVQGSLPAARAARRFVGGGDVPAVIETVRRLRERSLRASLYHLGEYVDSPAVVQRNVHQKLAVARQLGEHEFDVFVCVDPTQIGYSVSGDFGEANAMRVAGVIAEQPRRGVNLLMIEMEDYEWCQRSIDLHGRVKAAGLPVGLTIQAYLRRSDADVRRLVSQGATVRLVKGAFVEPGSRAYQGRASIAASYLHLSEELLSTDARTRGVYPIFATHDERVIEAVVAMAEGRGWQSDDYELELLLGVRPALAARLAAEGSRVRLYVPFGRDWWPYTIRRVGESPANLRFFIEAVLRR